MKNNTPALGDASHAQTSPETEQQLLLMAAVMRGALADDPAPPLKVSAPTISEALRVQVLHFSKGYVTTTIPVAACFRFCFKVNNSQFTAEINSGGEHLTGTFERTSPRSKTYRLVKIERRKVNQ